MGMESLLDPKVTAPPAGVLTGMNWIEGKKQDNDCQVKALAK
jgi:hypothetical protein